MNRFAIQFTIILIIITITITTYFVNNQLIFIIGMVVSIIMIYALLEKRSHKRQ